jgi:hypothetical protein
LATLTASASGPALPSGLGWPLHEQEVAMTKVNVSTWVKVKDGPEVSTSVEINPETVTQATISLDAAGGAAPEKTVELLAAAGSVSMLAIAVLDTTSNPATVTLTPVNGADTGTTITVTGALLVANDGVLAGMVPGGPRTLTLTNAGALGVTVDVIAARSD